MNTRRNKVRSALKGGDWLHFAATPTFALMALTTAIMGGDPANMLCQTLGGGLLSLGGMTVMYLLMAIFHAAPWWKWIALRTRNHANVVQDCVSNPTAGESR